MSSRAIVAITLILRSLAAANAQYTATYDPDHLPPTTETDQVGTNQCGTGNNQTSLCQNLNVNTLQDFCLWGPQTTGEIGQLEQVVIAYCSHPGRGQRLFPDGTLTGAHFVETPDYVQITGIAAGEKINIAAGDAGGELDPHGADGLGNPHGGLVFSNVWNNGTHGLGEQIHEWTNFMSVLEFCIRICKPTGPNPAAYCQHIYDVTGCGWNMPGDYSAGFTSCKSDSGLPPGLYPQPDGTTSTFQQGNGATPPAHPAPTPSACQTYQSTALYAATAFVTPTSVPSGTGTGTGSATATHSSSGAVAVKIGPATLCVLVTGILGLATGFGVVF